MELAPKAFNMTSVNIGKFGGLVGADPEVFIVDPKDTVIPAFTFLPAKNEKQSYGLPSMYWDGFQAEFKFSCGFHCLEQFRGAMKEKLNLLGARAIRAGGRLTIKNVVDIPSDWLKNLEDKYVELGCTPSENVYKRDPLMVEDPRKLKTRWAGGHMHFSMSSRPPYERVVRAMDNLAGLWAVGAAQKWDDPERRKYYGRAGEYRPTTYGNAFGVEYRVLSNFWLSHPLTYMMAFEVTRAAHAVGMIKDWFDLLVYDDELTQAAINTCDVKLARKLLTVNEKLWNVMLRSMFSDDRRKWMWQVGIEGIEAVVKKPDAIHENWDIGNAKFRSRIDLGINYCPPGQY